MFVLSLVFLVQICCGSIAAKTDNGYVQLPTLFALDDYKSCLQSLDDVYCVITAKVVGGNNEKLIRKIQNHSKVSTNFDYSVVDRGVCVKQTCHRHIPESTGGMDLSAVLQACVNDNLSRQYDVDTALADVYFCDEFGETQTLSWKSWMMISILAAIVALNFVGTFYDTKGKHPYIEAFCIPFHWKRLTIRTEEYENSRNGFLKGFDGARAILLFIIVVPHNAFAFGMFINNPQDFEQAATQNVFVKFLAGALSIVQIHFAMSGFLLAYNLELQSEKQRLSLRHFPVLFAYRWLRLISPYVLVLLATAYLFPLLGSGPLWKMYAEGLCNDCIKYFWHHMFFINNYMPNDQCLIQTWHIAADTQIFAAGLLVYLLAPPQRRQLALLALLVVGLAIPAYQIWLHNFEGVTIITPEMLRTLFTESFRLFHIRGHNNLVSFTVGMLIGMLIYRWRLTPNRNPPLGVMFWKVMMWLIVPLYVATLASVQWFQFDATPEDVYTRMAFCVVFQLMLGVISALATLTLATKAQGRPRWGLEWRGWRLVSGASYCAYLLHMHLIYYWIGTRRYLIEASATSLVVMQLVVFILSIIIAIPLHVMLEAPVNMVVKTFTNSLMREPDKKKQS